MKIGIFAVFDFKTTSYMTPFFAQTSPQAERMFQDVCRQQDHQFHNHPDDFTLFKLGEYDDTTGAITGNGIPESLVTAFHFHHMSNRKEK